MKVKPRLEMRLEIGGRWRAARRVLCGLGILWLAVPMAAQHQPAEPEAPAAFWLRRAFLVDPTVEGPPSRVDIRVAEGRIAEIRPSGSQQEKERIPTLPELDAEGRFLVPGWIDTHAHVALGPVTVEVVDGAPIMKMIEDPEVAKRSLPLLLAHGVTTIRDPGGSSRVLVDLRDRQARGELTGPRMRVAGEVIDHTPFQGLTASVQGVDEIRKEVRRQAAMGVDWIKLYTQLDRQELRAAIDEAHRHGVPTVAHLQRITWTEAAEMGLDALVHVVPGSELLLPEEARESYMPDLAGTQFLSSWFEKADFQSPEIEALLRSLNKHGVTVDLTLVAFEAMVLGDRAWRTRELRDLRWAAPGLVENWRSFFTFNIGWSEEDFRRARQAWPKALEFARLLHEAGILLTVGTDANNPWTVPGPSFHRELELLVEAGIPAREVLRMATVNGAEVLGLGREVGLLKPGMMADMVLLERNPLEDISAVREIHWVFQSGRLWRPEKLLSTIEAQLP